MAGLREIESGLPPGFRFYPSDEELVCHYLYKKVERERKLGVTMVDVDLHALEPWELPEEAKLAANEWYFFSFKDRKYATGCRANRATKSGYWKATGKDRAIHELASPSSTSNANNTIVGMRKTLVFYRGRAPNGIKSSWVMHEFRLERTRSPPPNENWVLCRVFNKRKEDYSSTNGDDRPETALSNRVFNGRRFNSFSPNDLHQYYSDDLHQFSLDVFQTNTTCTVDLVIPDQEECDESSRFMRGNYQLPYPGLGF